MRSVRSLGPRSLAVDELLEVQASLWASTAATELDPYQEGYAMARDPKDNVISIKLSAYHSIDLVRLPTSRKYRVVFAERFGVQRRAFVEISFEEALHLARFLASIEDGMRPFDPEDPPTNPGRPSTIPPKEVRELLKDYVGQDQDSVPEPIEPLDDPRTGVIAQIVAKRAKDDLD